MSAGNLINAILIVAVPGFGDVLLSTPLISAARRAWPRARIDVLVRGNVSGVLEGNDDVDEVIVTTRRAGLRRVLAMLRGRFRRYDLVLSNSASDRTAIYSLLMGKRRRISFVSAQDNGAFWKRWLYDDCVETDEDRGDDSHALLRINRLGELAGIATGQRIVNPRSPDSEKILADRLGDDWKERRYAVVHPAASLAAKQWHAEGWSSVVDYLTGTGLRVLVTGGPGAAERAYLTDVLASSAGSVTLLAGELRLGDLSLLLEHCSVYVGVDTLVSHMAASAGARTVALFGPSSPVRWGPWPYAYQAPVSPYRGTGTERVENVSIVNAAGDGLSSLDASRVLQVVQSMLESPGRSARNTVLHS